jgi:hypothetical protein
MEDSTTPSGVLQNTSLTLTSTGFYVVMSFKDGLVNVKFGEDMGKIQYIRAMVDADNENWMIVSEVREEYRDTIYLLMIA